MPNINIEVNEQQEAKIHDFLKTAQGFSIIFTDNGSVSFCGVNYDCRVKKIIFEVEKTESDKCQEKALET